MHMQLEISKCLGYGLKTTTFKVTMNRLKSIFFFPVDTVLSNNFVLTSFKWYLLRIMVFLVMGRTAENIEEENRQKKNIEK